MILDLGAEGSGSDGEPDLSWLPDPDKPKKYDREWNEVEDNCTNDCNVCNFLNSFSNLMFYLQNTFYNPIHFIMNIL